jgi:hypothetical protein
VGKVNRAEQEMQIAFFEWAKWQEGKYPELGLMHHIPNGGKRSKVEACIFKAMGVKKGVPDVFLPEARGIYHGLYIEFKAKGERPRAEQEDILAGLREAGYYAVCCDELQKAIKITTEYLNMPKVHMYYLLVDKYGIETADKCMLKEGMMDGI